MVYKIEVGETCINVYESPKGRGSERHVQYRAATRDLGGRVWGSWTTSIPSTVATLLPKLQLKETENDAVLEAATEVTVLGQPAMSHKLEKICCRRV